MDKVVDILDYEQVLKLLALIDIPILMVSPEDHKIFYANHSAEATFERASQQLLKLDIRVFIKNEFNEIYTLFLDNYEKMCNNSVDEFRIDNADFVEKISKVAYICFDRLFYFERNVILVQIHKINPNISSKNKIEFSDINNDKMLIEQTILLNKAEQKNLELSLIIENLEIYKRKAERDMLMLEERIANDAIKITSLHQEIEMLKKELDSKTKEIELEISKKNRELSKMQNELTDFTKLQSIILANLGHELRTPLNGILGFAQLIEIQDITDEVYNDVQLIKKSANRLKSTLDNLLLLSEIDSQERKVELTEFEMKHIEDFISAEYYELAKIKKLNFEIQIRNPLDKILIDPELMQVVFDVLLDNAFKFTKKGFVKVETEEYKTGKKEYILIKFKDSGCGIPKEKVDLVFKPFRQGSEGYERDYQGIGIGLSIAKKLLQFMDAEIGLISTLGKGTTFIIQIPKISSTI